MADLEKRIRVCVVRAVSDDGFGSDLPSSSQCADAVCRLLEPYSMPDDTRAPRPTAEYGAPDIRADLFAVAPIQSRPVRAELAAEQIHPTSST